MTALKLATFACLLTACTSLAVVDDRDTFATSVTPLRAEITPATAAIGKILFRETRFAQWFYAHARGSVNDGLAQVIRCSIRPRPSPNPSAVRIVTSRWTVPRAI